MNIKAIIRNLLRKKTTSRDYWLIDPSIARSKDLVSGYMNGQAVYDWLTVHIPLDFSSRVLDVGCGDGRVAGAFARDQRFVGSYSGFDISHERIKALQSLFRGNPRFTFKHADIYHSYYHPSGKIQPENYQYEYPNDSFDLIWCNSIFTHMKQSVIEQNLREVSRCLAPNGKAWLTFYCLDENWNPQSPETLWQFNTPFDSGYTAIPDNPEGCVGYRKADIVSMFERANLQIVKHVSGYWKARRTTLDQHEQDVFVVGKQLVKE